MTCPINAPYCSISSTHLIAFSCPLILSLRYQHTLLPYLLNTPFFVSLNYLSICALLGMFLRRQPEVSAEFSQYIANNVLNSQRVWNSILEGPKAEQFRSIGNTPFGSIITIPPCCCISSPYCCISQHTLLIYLINTPYCSILPTPLCCGILSTHPYCYISPTHPIDYLSP